MKAKALEVGNLNVFNWQNRLYMRQIGTRCSHIEVSFESHILHYLLFKMKMFSTRKRLTAKDKINILLSSYGSLTDFKIRIKSHGEVSKEL